MIGNCFFEHVQIKKKIRENETTETLLKPPGERKSRDLSPLDHEL